MNSDSSYVYDDYSAEEGLGRIAVRPADLQRNFPTTRAAARHNQNRRPPKLIKAPQPIVKRKPRPKPPPVKDRNSFVPPVRLKITAAKPKPTYQARSARKTAHAKSKKSKTKKVTQKNSNAFNKKATGKSGGILRGTFAVGGMEIKKTHAAMAGGATAGGLLLWKLLL